MKNAKFAAFAFGIVALGYLRSLFSKPIPLKERLRLLTRQ